MKWLCRLMQHAWRDTGFNPYMVAIEQRCKRCGTYRHHLASDLIGFEITLWREGKHPNGGTK